MCAIADSLYDEVLYQVSIVFTFYIFTQKTFLLSIQRRNENKKKLKSHYIVDLQVQLKQSSKCYLWANFLSAGC